MENFREFAGELIRADEVRPGDHVLFEVGESGEFVPWRIEASLIVGFSNNPVNIGGVEVRDVVILSSVDLNKILFITISTSIRVIETNEIRDVGSLITESNSFHVSTHLHQEKPEFMKVTRVDEKMGRIRMRNDEPIPVYLVKKEKKVLRRIH